VPELPEAETIVRGIRPVVSGRRIREVEVVHADVIDGGTGHLRRAVSGRRVAGVTRRAKNVLLELDDRSVVWINLGMTGRIRPLKKPRGARVARTRYGELATHPAVVFRLERGIDLVYDDSRRFGRIAALTPAESSHREATFGPEPLEDGFSGEILWRGLQTSRAPVRSWLLDQRRIAGLGNIYAAEALFRARIHPAQPACAIDRARAGALYRSIRAVLRAAVRAGGTTFRDYRDAEGQRGAFVRRLRVYDREGSPCPRCRTSIRREVFGNRSAFFCPACQPPRGRRRGPQRKEGSI